jgi:hypothetical protein
MRLVKIIEFLRNRLKTVIWVSCGVLILLFAVDVLFIGKEHAHTWAERRVPGFWSIFGFFACAVIILLSKWYGHLGIMTRENYYDSPTSEQSKGGKHD